MKYRLFQREFVPGILRGDKGTTIRCTAGDLEIGDRFSLRVWTGAPYRSPQEEFAQATVQSIEPVIIRNSILKLGTVVLLATGQHHTTWLEATEPEYLAWVARRDGFSTWAELTTWFQRIHGLPFAGQLITWDPRSLTPAYYA